MAASDETRSGSGDASGPDVRAGRDQTRGPTSFHDVGGGRGRADPEAIRRLEKFAYLLDEQFRIPGTSYRMGLDGLVGLIPGSAIRRQHCCRATFCSRPTAWACRTR